MRPRRRDVALWCWISAILCGLGCQSEPPKFSVTGKVVYAEDGKPVPGGAAIIFESTTPPYTRSSSNIDNAGEFTLGTDADGNGSIAGPHRVRLTGVASATQPDAVAALGYLMDRRYADFSKSGIVLTIEPNHQNEFVIKVERGTAKGQIPSAVQAANSELLVAPEGP